ncbi:MATE family efflux transporter [Dysgonomonas sp. 520]|uniref:MATE family efflux transporter n=1 Tax=Dysgonomonas sp. 520 TaxID=2302931 RepID=UPI0013D3E54C|nr:MATE family efflux transporter [Dysgonomonas sp. 520]NDW10243.1 MATE family efflux transporter [Dysgonomonas sp. 520]
MSFLQTYKSQYIATLRLAAPVMLSQLGVIAVQLFDNAMVGRLGALPLAAVAFGGTVFFLGFIFVTGISMALTPLVGEQFSQGKQHIAAAYFQNSLLLFTLVSFVSFALQYSITPLMYYMKQPPEVVDMAIPYYQYLVWSVIPYMIFGVFKQFLEGIGNTTVNMVIIITANLINIFFNWLLIYGNWGFPRMEAAGAGLATLISRICMPVFAILFFIFASKFRYYFSYFRKKNFSWIRIRNLLSVGLPISSQMFMEGSAFALTSIMMGWIGTVQIAANQIAMTISNCAFMIIIGLGSATTIRISHSYGRNDAPELKKAANASYHMGLMWNTFTAIMFIVFREQIARIFTDDPEVIRIASQLLIFVAAFQFSDGLQSISVGILRGIQDVKPIATIAFFSYIVINLPTGYLCAFIFNWGAGGLWVGFIFGLSIAAILLMRRLRKQQRKLALEFSQNNSAKQ